jgi:hypothetical protein
VAEKQVTTRRGFRPSTLITASSRSCRSPERTPALFGVGEQARVWFGWPRTRPDRPWPRLLNSKALPAAAGMAAFSAGLAGPPDEA